MCVFIIGSKKGGNMTKTKPEDIKKELNQIRAAGFTARKMAHLLDVGEATVHNWLRSDNGYVPRADQMDTLRAFAAGNEQKAS